jgi:putative toxin-antitoxin system antitoxin component (TIGR02293 family)
VTFLDGFRENHVPAEDHPGKKLIFRYRPRQFHPGKDLTRVGLWAICTVMRGISPPRGVSEGVVFPVRQGFSLVVVDRAVDGGKLSLAELDRLVLPRKTLAHRRILGSLTPDQSDRLSRVLRIVDEADTTFGDAKKAHAWLRRPTPLLDGEAPLDRLDTDFGTRQVEAMLGRIAHGLAV